MSRALHPSLPVVLVAVLLVAPAAGLAAPATATDGPAVDSGPADPEGPSALAGTPDGSLGDPGNGTNDTIDGVTDETSGDTDAVVDDTADVANPTDTVWNTTGYATDATWSTTRDPTNTTGGSLDGTTDTTDRLPNATDGSLDETTNLTDEATNVTDGSLDGTTDLAGDATNATDGMTNVTGVVRDGTDPVEETVDETDLEGADGTVEAVNATLTGDAGSVLSDARASLETGITLQGPGGVDGSVGTGGVKATVEVGGEAADGRDAPDADGGSGTGDGAGPTSPVGELSVPIPTPADDPVTTGVASAGILGALGLVARRLVLDGSGGSAGTLGAVWTNATARGRGVVGSVRRFFWARWYQRYDDTDPLEHERRERIYATVEDRPGIHLSAIEAETGIPLGTVRYHLKILDHENLITRAEMRGKHRVFPVDADPSELAAARNDEAAAAVLTELAEGGPDSVSGLAEALDRDPSTITHHVERLAEDGLVEREREGRAVINRLVPGVESALRSEPGERRAAAGDRVATPSDD